MASKDSSPSTTITRISSQIAELTSQRDALLLKYIALQQSRAKDQSDSLTEQQLQEALVAAQATLSRHIKLLHDYNEIRDVGQGLMGLIAEQKGVRLLDVMEEFGAMEGD